MNKLEKAVWITGASSGIGKELVNEFLRAGEIVIATARKINSLDSIKKEFNNTSEKLFTFSLDISDKNAVKEFYETMRDKLEINCLINNAGATSFKKAEQDSIDEIEKIINTNLLGSIYAIKNVLPDMINKKSGTIVNLLSVVTKKVFDNSSAYSASKTGLAAYANSLREEVRKHNIRVVNVSPGATQTPIWPNTALEKYSYRMMSPADLAKFIYQVFSIKSNMVVEDVVIRPVQGDI